MAKTILDLSDVIVSPEFKQEITILRDEGGNWFKGEYTKTLKAYKTFGVVSATDEREIQFLPEGDRESELKTIHVNIPIYTTRGGSIGRDADIIVWNDEQYKVIKIQNSGDYGYWRGIISKIGTGDNNG